MKARASLRTLLFGLWALACSVDHRRLHPGPDLAEAGAAEQDPGSNDAGGTNGSAGGSSSGGGTATGHAGDGDADGGAPITTGSAPLVEGCADLDTDGVADCKVTLVKNPSFKSDVESWTVAAPATLAWNPRNALSDAPSGCAMLTLAGTNDFDGNAAFSASQCVAVSANQLLIAYANVLVASPPDPAGPFQAELKVSFYDRDDCQGDSSKEFFTPPSAGAGWATVQAGGTAGLQTKSAAIALVGLKPYRANALSVCFDNVMLKAQSP